MNVSEQLILTPCEQTTINRWSQGKSFPFRLIQRAQIIQLSAQGIFNHDIATQLNISRPTGGYGTLMTK